MPPTKAAENVSTISFAACKEEDEQEEEEAEAEGVEGTGDEDNEYLDGLLILDL